jgi:hypothetical protein
MRLNEKIRPERARSAVALLFLVELLQQRLHLLARARASRGDALGQVHLEPHLLRPVEVLADDLGVVEGPLVGGLLLGQQHLFHGVIAAEGRDGQDHRVDAVTSATRRLKELAACSCSSSGLGSSTSAIRLVACGGNLPSSAGFAGATGSGGGSEGALDAPNPY